MERGHVLMIGHIDVLTSKLFERGWIERAFGIIEIRCQSPEPSFLSRAGGDHIAIEVEQGLIAWFGLRVVAPEHTIPGIGIVARH